MVDGEKELLRLLQSHRYNKARLEETTERLLSSSHKITPSYSNTGGGGSGGRYSKVESFAEKTEKLKAAIREYRRDVQAVETALACPELSKRELKVLNWIADGWRLSTLAMAEYVYISQIYKIRDRALKKASRHLETRNGAKHG